MRTWQLPPSKSAQGSVPGTTNFPLYEHDFSAVQDTLPLHQGKVQSDYIVAF